MDEGTGQGGAGGGTTGAGAGSGAGAEGAGAGTGGGNAGAGTGAGAGAGSGAAGGGSGAGAGTGGGTASGGTRTFDETYVSSIRDEAATNRVAARDASAQAAAEKKRADDAEEALKGVAFDRSLETGMSEAGKQLNMATVKKLLSGETKIGEVTIERDEKTGAIKNAKAVVEALLTTYTFLEGQGDTTAANPARTTAGNNGDKEATLNKQFAATGRRASSNGAVRL